METICGNCGRILDDEEKYCGECGTKRGEEKYKPTIKEIPYVYGSSFQFKEEPSFAIKTVRCDNCRLVFGADFNLNKIFCPSCNAKVQKKVFKEELKQNFCENCGRRLEDEEKYCGKCGTKRGDTKYEPSITEIQELYASPFPTKEKWYKKLFKKDIN